MVFAADYPFLDVVWSMLVFFGFVIWISLLFTVFGDVFRRDDISGFGKAAWLLFVIVLPYLGVFIYLIAHSKGMAERRLQKTQEAQTQFDDYVRTTASKGGAAAEIDKAKQLLDSGAITQAEFDSLKAKALA
jgi:Short C-terminal domain/Phospholipase_D-nuclease N-terminal